MNLNFDGVLEGMWCRWTELNCRHQPFQNVIVLHNTLNLYAIVYCGGLGNQMDNRPFPIDPAEADPNPGKLTTRHLRIGVAFGQRQG